MFLGLEPVSGATVRLVAITKQLFIPNDGAFLDPCILGAKL